MEVLSLNEMVSGYLGRLGNRLQLKCDGTRCRMGGEVKGKLANRVVASTLHTTSEHVYPALLPLMLTPQLPVVD